MKSYPMKEEFLKQCAESWRMAEREKAFKDWNELTNGSWPDDQHEQRFEALVRLALTHGPKKNK